MTGKTKRAAFACFLAGGMLLVLVMVGHRRELALLVRVAFSSGDPQAEAVTACTERDLGSVAAGKRLSVRFPVYNQGDKRLILERRGTSCECAASEQAETSEIIVQPGATGEVEAMVETARLSGLVRLELRYATNDPQRPILTFAVLADVR